MNLQDKRRDLENKWLYNINPVFHCSIPKAIKKKLQIPEISESHEDTFKRYFNKVPLAFFHDPDITDCMLRALIQIQGMCDNLEGGNYSGHAYMGSLTAKKKSTFKKIAKQLREKRYIHTFRKSVGSTNQYLVVDIDLRYQPYNGKPASALHWDDWKEMAKSNKLTQYFKESLKYFEKNYSNGERFINTQNILVPEGDLALPPDFNTPLPQPNITPTRGGQNGLV